MSEDVGQVKKTGGLTKPISRHAAFLKISSRFQKALDTITELMDSPNDSVRLGAANKIMDKMIPNLRALEVSTEDGTPTIIVKWQDASKDSAHSIPTDESPETTA